MLYRRRSPVIVAMLAMSITLSACAIVVEAQDLKRLLLLTVVDANGTLVGRVPPGVGQESESAVAFQVDDHVFVLRVLPDRFSGVAHEVSFETPDCSGTPFLPSPGALMLPYAAVVGLSDTVFLGDCEATPRVVQSLSVLMEKSGCQQRKLTTYYIQAIAVIDLAPRFAPPFSVR